MTASSPPSSHNCTKPEHTVTDPCSPSFIAATRQLIARTPGVRPRTSVFARKLAFLRKTVFARPWLMAGALVCPAVVRFLPPPAQHFVLSCLVLWGWGLLASQAQHRLFEHPDHFVFPLLPISNAEILQQQLRAILLSVRSLAVAAFLGFGPLPALLFDDVPWLWASVRSAVLTVLLLSMGASYTIASLRWNWPGWIARAVPGVALAATVGFRISPEFKARLYQGLQDHGDTLAACLPPGWAILPWAAWEGSAPFITALALLPAIPMIAWIPSGWTWVRENYRIREIVLLRFLTEVPEDADEDFAEAVAQSIQSKPSRGRTAITDSILERGFLQPIQPPQNPIQRLIWRWWTPRQRVAAEFLSGTREWPDWSRSFRTGLIAIAVTWITQVIAHRFFPDFKWVVIAPIALAVLALFPGPSIYQIRWFPLGSGGVGVSPIHLFPMTLQDVVRLRWKVVLIRSCLSTPIASVATAVGFVLWEEPAWAGAVIGAQLALAPAYLSPILTAYRLDTLLSTAVGSRRPWAFQMLRVVMAILLLLNILVFLALILPFFGLAAGGFMALLNHGFIVAMTRYINRVRMEAIVPQPGQ